MRCFVIPNQEMTAKNIRVEVNPLWCGQIAHEAISDDMKVRSLLFACGMCALLSRVSVLI